MRKIAKMHFKRNEVSIRTSDACHMIKVQSDDGGGCGDMPAVVGFDESVK